MDNLHHKFMDWIFSLGLTLEDPARQLEQFERYFQLLVEWNEKMNLTGITERNQVFEKHFYDSLTVAGVSGFRQAETLVDIGSGAGFPSLPLKIVFPRLKITIVDALAKRIRFLETVVSELGLKQVLCLHGRAEEVARQSEHRDRYDIATARAVARLSALNELCLPFVRTGGFFIAMKGSEIEEELHESLYSAGKLQAGLRLTTPLKLPVEGSARNLVVFDKTGATPNAYPRKPGTPLKEPLVPGVVNRPDSH